MILWMAGIFAFSSRSGDESTEDSYFAGTMVGDLFVPGFDEWSMERQQEFAEMIDHPVRKTAMRRSMRYLGCWRRVYVFRLRSGIEVKMS